MENTARLFNSTRCHRQMLIYSHCGRGNINCDARCSQTAGVKSLRAPDGLISMFARDVSPTPGDRIATGPACRK